MARRYNRKPLTEAERDARRKADRERIEQAARALLTSDGWRRWIKVRASNGLSRYSLFIWGLLSPSVYATIVSINDMSPTRLMPLTVSRTSAD